MRYKYLAVSLLLLLVSFSSFAAELEKNQIYRLHVSICGLKKTDGSGEYTAAAPSKFRVLDNTGKDNYVIRFVAVYNLADRANKGQHTVISTVLKDEAYLLPKIYNGADVSMMSAAAFFGPVSGPLVVPFKFRLDDDSVTGEATIGYYAGYSWSLGIGYGNRIPITPFLSGGLSQVSVDGDESSESKSAFTWAAGLLIQNWGNVNIGFLYGEDRIGDQTWGHEGEGWLSFMVGWTLD